MLLGPHENPPGDQYLRSKGVNHGSSNRDRHMYEVQSGFDVKKLVTCPQ